MRDNIRKYLLNSKNFEEFFIRVSILRVKLSNIELKKLKIELNREIYSNKYSSRSLVYLRDTLDTELLIPCRHPYKDQLSEYDLREYIVKNFSKIFPKYKYMNKEVVVENIGRIDILARDKETNRDVIIEIKRDKENPNKQLLAYAKGYDNSILIGITNIDKKFYLDNIIYYTIDYILNNKE